MVLLEAARRAAQIRVVEPVIRHAAAPDVVESIRAAAVRLNAQALALARPALTPALSKRDSRTLPGGPRERVTC